MQLKLPLTLTLSPSDGAREEIAVSHMHSLNSQSIAASKTFSLSPSDGERVRVRGPVMAMDEVPEEKQSPC
jgi:hypothetical protein